MIGRAWLLATFFSLMVLVLVGRLAQLQLIEGSRYALQIDDDRLVVDFIPARRGRILDRHGTPLVDNRAVYHVAVVLSQLELDRRTRRRLPYWELDAQQFDALLADLSVRTMAEDQLQLRQLVIDTLVRFPGVSIRRGKRRGSGSLGVIGMAQGDLAAFSDQIDDGSNRIGELVEFGLLTDNPAAALEREFLERRGQQARLLDPAEVDRICTQLGFRFDVPSELIRARLLPFLPIIRLQDAEAQVGWRWHLLTDDGRARGEDAVARYIGIEPLILHEYLTDLLDASPRRERSNEWIFLPESYADRGARYLPPGLPVETFQVHGAPVPHERLYIIQGDSDEERHDEAGLLSNLCHRLSLAMRESLTRANFPPDELGFLIRRHATRRSALSLERRFRVHQIGFDRSRLERFCLGLAEELTNRGRATTPLEIEEQITMARRRADRDWAGATRNDPLVLVHDVDPDIARNLMGMGEDLGTLPTAIDGDYENTAARLPGLRITTDMGRTYPFDGHASHLTGWLKRLSAELDRETALAYGLDPMGWVGDRMGLEYAYDRELQGVVGRRQRLRVPGGYRDIIGGDREARAGQDLRTTLDMEVQIATEAALANWIDLAIELGTLPTSRTSLADIRAARSVGNGRGGFVLMDVHTGGIIALASTPTFKLSEIRDRYHELLDGDEHPGEPLHDHASWPTLSPGSTIKVLVAIAAYMEGAFHVGETIKTPGHLGTWRGGYMMPDHAPYGPYQGGNDWTMDIAIQESSNSFFATLGERLGDDTLARWYRLFGIGEKNAVDVTWQRSGFLTWSDTVATSRPDEPWNTSDTWRMAIGQFVTPCASPLQLVSIPACVANGGTVLRPYLAERSAHEAVVTRLDIPPPALQAIRRGMEQVTGPQGTASYLRLGGDWSHLKVAAKTGTSEWGTRRDPKPDNAWLIGYAPADNPEVAFACAIFAAGTSGGRACSGVAKAVLEAWFDCSRGRAAANLDGAADAPTSP